MKRLLIGLVCLSSLSAIAKPSAIVENQITRYSVRQPNKLVVSEFTRIKILDESGYSFAIFQDYHDSFRHIRSLKVTVFDAAGNRIKKLTKADALDLMFNPSYEINDARILYLDPKFGIYPFTVEIDVEIAYDSFLSFPVWMPRSYHNLEVKNASLTLETYKSFVFRSRELNGVTAPRKVVGPEINTYVWSLKDLSAESQQVNYKLFEMSQPKVHVVPMGFSLENKPGSFYSWEEFGNWFLYINNDRDALTAETKARLNELKKKNLPVKEIVREIYQHMQNKTRYISIQLGIGGFQTIPSDEVERTGYGDCKALTNYMKAMLHHVGIESNYILVRAGEDASDIISDFPSSQFNHVFLGVPLEKDTLLLECTSQLSPPSYIGTFTDDRNVLWISQYKSKIIRTPVYTEKENIKHTKAIASMNEQGTMDLALEVKQEGIFFDELADYKHMKADQVEKFNYGKFNYKSFNIQSFTYGEYDKNSPVLNLKYTLKIDGLAKPVVGKLVIPVNILPQLDAELAIDQVNKVCDIARGFTLEDEVEIQLPENYRVDFLPEEIKEVSDFGSLEIKVSVDSKSGNIQIKRKAMFKKGLYQKEAFDGFNQYLKKVRALDQSKLVLQSKT